METTCPTCQSEEIEDSDYLDDKKQCNDCGATFDPANGEEVEEWTVDLYCNLSDMTRTEATEYIHDMIDQIERTTGFRLALDRLT